MSENKQYENEYKVQAVKLAKKIGAVNAANELQIPVNTLYGWIRKARIGSLDIGCGERSPEESLNIAEENQQLRKRTKTFSKKMIYAVIIILIIMLITIAFCCTPSSLIGKSALMRLAVTIPINILFQIILYLGASLLIFYVFHNLIRENNKVKQLIANIICTFICIFLGYALITDSYVSILRGNIKGDFLLWQDVLLDLHDSDVKSINNLKIKDFYFPGEVSHTSASRDSLYIVAVDKEGTSYRFPITQKDKMLITDKDNSELRYGEIKYYKKSGLMKSISFSKESKKTSEIQMVEITLTEEEIAHEKRILVNRPEVDSYDKNLFWYITKNGKFCECFQAYSKIWTNILTFADKGNYTVTLVTDYYDTTGEYTPISNTIEYTVE